MNKLKNIAIVSLMTFSVLSLTACSSTNNKSTSSSSEKKSSIVSKDKEDTSTVPTSKVNYKTTDFANTQDLMDSLKSKSNQIEGSTVTTTLTGSDGNLSTDQTLDNVKFESYNYDTLPLQSQLKMTIVSYNKNGDNYTFFVTTKDTTVNTGGPSLPVQNQLSSNNYKYVYSSENTTIPTYNTPWDFYKAYKEDPKSANDPSKFIGFRLTGEKNSQGYYAVENSKGKVFVSLEAHLSSVYVGKLFNGSIKSVKTDPDNKSVLDVTLVFGNEGTSQY